jgi:quercetin dioxygenase-like cupin family protein
MAYEFVPANSPVLVADRFIVILDGTCDVTMPDGEKKTITQGGHIGEGGNESARVKAIDDSHLAVMMKSDFLKCLKRVTINA